MEAQLQPHHAPVQGALHRREADPGHLEGPEEFFHPEQNLDQVVRFEGWNCQGNVRLKRVCDRICECLRESIACL